MYGIEKRGFKDVDNARHRLFAKAKRDLDILPPTNYALELHIKSQNYQAKVWLQADPAAMNNLENETTETIGWLEGACEREEVFKRLPTILDGCN